jgi:bifunctional ADP-heptose synthase (sugar kinase/adenylyltransferase)
MSTLICGSIAFDSIMVFHDRFRNHILPEQLHILNVSFFVPEMRREFGGCAGNIAYSLKLLGGAPLIMATVGDDETARARAVWARKFDGPPSDAKSWAKQARFLQSRGFSVDSIHKVLREHPEQDE